VLLGKRVLDILLPLRTNGGQRHYTPEHVSIIVEIKMLKKEELIFWLREWRRLLRWKSLGFFRGKRDKRCHLYLTIKKLGCIRKFDQK